MDRKTKTTYPSTYFVCRGIISHLNGLKCQGRRKFILILHIKFQPNIPSHSVESGDLISFAILVMAAILNS